MPSPLSDILKLKRWMEEYVLDQRMGEEKLCEFEKVGDVDFSGEPEAEENQIRLWPAVREGDQPLYGLIRPDGYDRWRVFPFSPYAFPAMPDELLIREDPPVQVIQGWNTRSVPSGQVEKSWRVADLPVEKAFLLERWWVMVQSGTLPSERFGEDIGPELRHPLDPRFEYMDFERERVDQVLGEATVEYGTGGMQMAAEEDEGEEYGAPGPDPSDEDNV